MPNRSGLTKSLSLLLATVLFWGLSFLSIKVAVAAIPPMSLGLARFLIAIVVLFFLKRRMAPEERLSRRDIPLMAAAGLIGVTAYFFFENNGVKLISASESSIIIAVIPVITMLAERLFSKTKISAVQYAGAALSMGGVWILVAESFTLTLDIRGYLFMLGAAASWVGYCFLTKPLFERHSRIGIVFYQTLFGIAGFLPFAALELGQWNATGPVVWANVAYLGVFCSALGYYFYVSALGSLGVSVSAVFINLIPVVTVLAGFFLLGERLSAVQWAGGAIVLVGVYLATLGSRKEAREER
jgi:drug/metabolite transporter (DMT)-like permease